jgi:hypothetical protein
MERAGQSLPEGKLEPTISFASLELLMRAGASDRLID